MQVLVECQVPNFEIVISFELRLEYGKYAYHWNRQTVLSLKSGKEAHLFQLKNPDNPFKNMLYVLSIRSVKEFGVAREER